MFKFLLHTIAVVAFSAATVSANAQSYTFIENFNLSSVSSNVLTWTPSLHQIFVGSSTTPSTTIQLTTLTTNLMTATTGTWSNTFSEGSTLSGTFTITNSFNNSFLAGTTNVTGGTGIFSSASGQGTFSTLFGYAGQGFSTSTVRFNTPTTPVPEAETYGMMLMGLVSMGFIARRNKNS